VEHKKVMTVKGINLQESAVGDRKATLVMKGAGLRGESTLKLVIEEEDSQGFAMGEFYEISWKQVEKPA
jgi:hypothetical protein